MGTKPLIAILTDFGTQDPFVGVMKGVITKIAPSARIIDLTHQIPPGDIRRAAVQLWQARYYFPAGTIFLCVVDPGVGTARKGIALETGGSFFVGPDNGLFSYIFDQDPRIFELANPSYQLQNPSSTFHGRDIFAPAAGYLGAGVQLDSFGNQIKTPVSLPNPLLKPYQNPSGSEPSTFSIAGETLYPDRFGNILTSLGKFTKSGSDCWLTPWIGIYPESFPPFAPKDARLDLEDGTTLKWANTFADIPSGECAALIGSTGLLEIAARGKSAAQILELSGGERVVLHVHSKL